MSFTALAAVSKMRAASAAEKLVALAYADRHNEETGCAYPSLAWLCEFSSLNRKTVIAAVMRLEQAGFLTDTGERKGDTRQIKVYRVDLETVPKTERFQKRNSTEKGAKQSQKRDTDTVRTSPQKATPSSVARATKSRIPANFIPVISGKTAATVDGWPPGRLEDELEAFTDYHASHETRSADWDASWRTWVRNSKRWEPRNGQRTSNDRSEHQNPLFRAAFGSPGASQIGR